MGNGGKQNKNRNTGKKSIMKQMKGNRVMRQLAGNPFMVFVGYAVWAVIIIVIVYGIYQSIAK